MTPSEDRWHRVDKVLQGALDLPPKERDAFVAKECGEDEELRASVLKLLRAAESEATWMPPGGAFDALDSLDLGNLDEAELEDKPRVGNYRLLQRLGEGGMGEVFDALQEQPFRRRVAIKLIRPGMGTKEVLARFESERQALAVMDHPNIAKVFDAGISDDGRPYFVMELVSGDPINEYCDRARLTPERRLDLFLGVCDGIEHAHRKGIIHRDLKPSNILVTLQEDRATAKIIDFGVAKATAQPLTDETLYTAMGQVIGTPSYMSPEQAEMSGQSIDTRSDVYSLGAVLYELLVGARPLELTSLRDAGIGQIVRAIRDTEAVRPSVRVAELSQQGEDDYARTHATEAQRLTRLLSGDLDWITMKALEKDRTRRYGSVSELADDIGRHLRDEAVEAGPPTASYRFGKFAKRHRVPLAIATAIVFGLIVAGAALTYALIESNRQRAEAQIAREEAEAVTDFLADMLGAADPTEQGRDVSVLEVLDQASSNVQSTFDDRPAVAATLLETIGTTYMSLGEDERAFEHLKQALEVSHDEFGESGAATLRASQSLAMLQMYRGEYDHAEELFLKSLGVAEAEIGATSIEASMIRADLAQLYQKLSRYQESESLYVAAAAFLDQALGPDHPDAFRTRNNLSVLYMKLGRYDECEPIVREVYERHIRHYGQEHPNTLQVANNHASVLRYLKRYEEAAPVLEQTIETQTRVLGFDHRRTLSARNNLALVYKALERYDDAIDVATQVLQTQRKTKGEKHLHTIISAGNLGDTHTDAGNPERAAVLLRDALRMAKLVIPNHVVTGATHQKYARCLVELGQFDEAEAHLLSAHDNHTKTLGPNHERTNDIVSDLVAVYERTSQPDAAAAWREKLR